MTPKEQKEFWLKFHRFQMRYELMYTPKINKVLKDQIQQYISTKDTIYVRSGGLYAVLLDLYKTTGTAWAYQTRGLLAKKAGGQMGFSERVVNIMRQIFEFELLSTAENITQTTIRLIQEVLTEAALEGWSFDEIVKRLVSPDMTAKRARLIARTETVNAANAGSMANLKAAGATKKIWIAARDNRTREHHREVNQTVIGIDEQFKVGDSFMQHPGDKSGLAAEVCNCRCAVAGVV
jgi:SPP1 gp7 family putative phage head morphogenesis protein